MTDADGRPDWVPTRASYDGEWTVPGGRDVVLRGVPAGAVLRVHSSGSAPTRIRSTGPVDPSAVLEVIGRESPFPVMNEAGFGRVRLVGGGGRIRIGAALRVEVDAPGTCVLTAAERHVDVHVSAGPAVIEGDISIASFESSTDEHVDVQVAFGTGASVRSRGPLSLRSIVGIEVSCAADLMIDGDVEKSKVRAAAPVVVTGSARLSRFDIEGGIGDRTLVVGSEIPEAGYFPSLRPDPAAYNWRTMSLGSLVECIVVAMRPGWVYVGDVTDSNVTIDGSMVASTLTWTGGGATAQLSVTDSVFVAGSIRGGGRAKLAAGVVASETIEDVAEVKAQTVTCGGMRSVHLDVDEISIATHATAVTGTLRSRVSIGHHTGAIEWLPSEAQTFVAQSIGYVRVIPQSTRKPTVLLLGSGHEGWISASTPLSIDIPDRSEDGPAIETPTVCARRGLEGSLVIDARTVTRMPLHFADAAPDLDITGQIGLYVKNARALRLRAHGRILVHAEDREPHDSVHLGGCGRIQLDSTADEVHASLCDIHRTPVEVETGPTGVIFQLSGHCRLGQVDGQIKGAAEPPKIHGLAEQALPSKGLVVGVDPTAIDASQIGFVEGIAVFEPAPTPVRAFAAEHGLKDFPLRLRSQWAHELARIVGSRANSGRSVAATKWAASRLHHRTLDRGFEKTVRNVHRWLGYGYKPLWPGLIWISTAMLATTLSLTHPPLTEFAWCWPAIEVGENETQRDAEIRTEEEACASNVGEFGRISLETLTFPTRIFRLSDESSPFRYVGRTYEPLLAIGVGVGFVFFVIACRNYFRLQVDSAKR